MKNKSYYRKLYIAFLMIIVIYTAVAVGVFAARTDAMNKQKYHSDNVESLRQLKSQIDMKYDVVFDVVKYLKTKDEVKVYASETERNFYTIVEVDKLLEESLLGDSLVRYDIGIMKSNDDLMITTEGSKSTKRFFKEKAFTEAQEGEVLEYLKDDTLFDRYVCIPTVVNEVGEIRNTITWVIKTTVNFDDAIIFFITFDEDELIDFNERPGNLGLMIAQRNQIVSFQGTDMLESEASKFVKDDILRILEDHSENEVQRYDYKGYYLYIDESDVMNWSYIYVTKRSSVYPEIKYLITNSIVIYIILLLAGVILTRRMTKRAYEPINTIVQSVSSEDDGTDSILDEMNFISKRISSMQEANQKLLKINSRNRLPLKSKFIIDLLSGILPEDEIDTKIEQYHMNFLENEFVICYMMFQNLEKLEENMSKQAVLDTRKYIKTLLMERISPNMQAEIIDYGHDSYVLFVEGDTEQAKNELKAIITEIESQLSISLKVSVSKPVRSVNEVESAFYETGKNLEYQYVFQNKVVITSEDVMNIINRHYYYPVDEEKKLINQVIYGNKTQVDSIIDMLFKENYENRTLSKESNSLFVLGMIATINRVLQKLDCKISDVDDSGLMVFMDLKMCVNYRELNIKFKNVFDKIMTVAEERNQNEDNDISEKMIEFVHQNYSRDISLDDLGEAFNLTTGYIGVLFKEKTSNNFKDYLNKFRVEQAKEMMRGMKDVKVKDVADSVGCSNINTFIRIFKKYEGTSPGKYQKMLWNND